MICVNAAMLFRCFAVAPKRVHARAVHVTRILYTQNYISESHTTIREKTRLIHTAVEYHGVDTYQPDERRKESQTHEADDPSGWVFKEG